jgi:hypothetical protein
VSQGSLARGGKSFKSRKPGHVLDETKCEWLLVDENVQCVSRGLEERCHTNTWKKAPLGCRIDQHRQASVFSVHEKKQKKSKYELMSYHHPSTGPSKCQMKVSIKKKQRKKIQITLKITFEKHTRLLSAKRLAALDAFV